MDIFKLTNLLRAQAESWRTVLGNEIYNKTSLPNDPQHRTAQQIASQALDNLKIVKRASQDVSKKKNPKIPDKLFKLSDSNQLNEKNQTSLAYDIADNSGIIADTVERMADTNKTVRLNDSTEISINDLINELVNDDEQRIKLIENGYKQLAED